MIYNMIFENFARYINDMKTYSEYPLIVPNGIYGPKLQARGKSTSLPAIAAAYIKDHPEDKFSFVISALQINRWNLWIKEFNLEEHMLYKQKEMIYNHNYIGPDYTPRLQFFVLGAKGGSL
jgi:hypothetical protein